MTKITLNAYDDRDFLSEAEKHAINEVIASVPADAVLSADTLLRPAETDSTGQAITTDLVFEMFAALVPDSPWSTRLLKIRDLFNLMGSGIAELMDNPHFDLGDRVYDVREREGEGWEGKSVISFSHAVSKLTEAHVALRPVRKDAEDAT